MPDKLLGYCGLFCGGCPVYQGTMSNKPLLTENGDPLLCNGCESDRTTTWCTDCNIKICCRKKNIRTCIDCKENPCNILTKFIQDENYPYHTEVQENMKQLKDIGLDEWIKIKSEKYKCKNCNSPVNWIEKQCPECKKDL